MVTVYDVYPYDLIVAVAEKLKNIEGIKPPDQLMFWKSSSYHWDVIGWPSDLGSITREQANILT